MILTASVLVRFVFAFRFAVTEQLFVDALGVTAGQLAVGTNWLVGLQERQHFPRFYGGACAITRQKTETRRKVKLATKKRRETL